VISVQNDNWTDLPEKELYDKREVISTIFKQSKWNIYPFKAFDDVVIDNCKK
jgi:uncharacterized sporulation protein YeaH/YhbH (DUF444 family)